MFHGAYQILLLGVMACSEGAPSNLGRCASSSDCPVGLLCEAGACVAPMDRVPDAGDPPGEAAAPIPPGATVSPFDAGPASDAGSVPAADASGARGMCTPGATMVCVSACGSGRRTCIDGAFGPCEGPTEICNGIDDDCDGLIDEGLVCEGTPSMLPAPGFFRSGAAGQFANDVGHYCTMASWEQYIACGGPLPFENLTDVPEPAHLVWDGACRCGYPSPGIFRLTDGTGAFANTIGHYCTFGSWEQFVRCSGNGEWLSYPVFPNAAGLAFDGQCTC